MRFKKIWRCDGCRKELPTGEYLLCRECDAMYWGAVDLKRRRDDAKIAREIARHDRFKPDDPDGYQAALNAMMNSVMGSLAPKVTVAAIDEDIVEAVVERIDEIIVPETPRGTKLVRVGPGLWSEVLP